MIRTVRIHMEDAESIPALGPKVRRVDFSLLAAVNVTAKLFVVQRTPVDNELGYSVVYKTIATAADLDNLTENTPPTDEPWTPYRVDAITVTADVPENPADQDDIDKFIIMLQRRIKSLFLALKRFETPTASDITITV